MKLNTLASLLFCGVVMGCNVIRPGEKTDVDVEVVNRSAHELRNAYAHFGENRCDWGNVGETFSAGYGFFASPITPDVELHWDDARGQHIEEIDLRKIYPPGKSGRLTFTVFDDRVEATFKPAD